MTTNDISTTTNLNQISETQMRWAILYFVFVFLFFGPFLNLSTCAVCIRVTKSADHWLHFEMEILCVAFGHSRRYSMQETWVLKVRRRPINQTIIQIVARFSSVVWMTLVGSIEHTHWGLNRSD